MELGAILLARAGAWVESNDLNPRGKVFYPELVKAIVGRYGFRKFPEKPEDFDESKGITFAGGQFGYSVIDQLIIYTYGLVLDTRSSTQESRRLLEEALGWASKELGIVYKSKMIKRWQYTSQVTFYSNAPFIEINTATRKLAEQVSKSVSELNGDQIKYDFAGLTFNHDLLARKHPLGQFTIQRRDNTAYSENKYFSDAPLPTDVHLRLLEQFELDISSK